MHRQLRRLAPVVLLALLAVLAPAAASAQVLFSYSASALVGFGGSPDAESGDNLDNGSYQLGFSVVTERNTRVGLRLGQIGFDDAEPLGGLFDADLTYVTLAGEYTFEERYYDSGMYLGLGGYRLEGRRAGGQGEDETAIGLALGVTGDFPITRNFGILVELSGHFTDLEETQFFAMGHAGVVFHF